MKTWRVGHRPRVGIISETGTAHMRGILRGIAAYARDHGPWEFSGQPRRAHEDIVAVRDPAVSRALTFIRDNATTGVQVPDVARHAGVSRRSLEVRF